MPLSTSCAEGEVVATWLEQYFAFEGKPEVLHRHEVSTDDVGDEVYWFIGKVFVGVGCGLEEEELETDFELGEDL